MRIFEAALASPRRAAIRADWIERQNSAWCRFSIAVPRWWARSTRSRRSARTWTSVTGVWDGHSTYAPPPMMKINAKADHAGAA